MKRFSRLAFILVLMFACTVAGGLVVAFWPSPTGPVLLPWPVERVVDGDTVAAGGYRVRLYGINAPEIRGTCEEGKELGEKSKARLEELIAGAGTVELRAAPPGKYSQLQAWLILDGRDAAEVLVAEGLARPYDGGTKPGWCPKPE